MRPILISEPDMLRLAELLEEEGRWPSANRHHLRALRHELAAATVTGDDQIPHDVVTLLSRLRVKDLGTEEAAAYLLVTPAHASPASGAISVLSPIGAELLGRRSGDEVHCRVSGDMRRLRIEEVLFQPEAAARRSRDGSISGRSQGSSAAPSRPSSMAA